MIGYSCFLVIISQCIVHLSIVLCYFVFYTHNQMYELITQGRRCRRKTIWKQNHPFSDPVPFNKAAVRINSQLWACFAEYFQSGRKINKRKDMVFWFHHPLRVCTAEKYSKSLHNLAGPFLAGMPAPDAPADNSGSGTMLAEQERIHTAPALVDLASFVWIFQSVGSHPFITLSN